MVKCRIERKAIANFDPTAPEPVIPLSQIRVLTEMWRVLKDDITRIGVVTFVK